MKPPAPRPSAGRLLVVAASGTLLACAALALALPPLAALAPPAAGSTGMGTALAAAPPGSLLVAGAASVLVACTAWLWVGGVVALVRLGTGVGPGNGTARPRGVPTVVHRAVLGACGAAVAGVVAAFPAGAVPTPLHEGPRMVPPSPAGLSPLTPSRSAPAPSASTAAWRVRSGDSLWAVAEATLPRTAPRPPTNGAVARRVRALHRVNRAAVPDPDLIHPGQLLRLPRA